MKLNCYEETNQAFEFFICLTTKGWALTNSLKIIIRCVLIKASNGIDPFTSAHSLHKTPRSISDGQDVNTRF